MISSQHGIRKGVICVAILIGCVFLAYRRSPEDRSVGKLTRESSITTNPLGTALENTVDPSGSRNRLAIEQSNRDLSTLNQLERARFDSAINSFKEYLKDLEFAHSELLWHGELEDRAIRLYKQLPPSENDMKYVDREIDRIIADHQLGLKERRVFAHYAPEEIEIYLIPKEKIGGIFFQIPSDPSKNIFIEKSVGTPNLEKMVAELDASGGMNASGLGSSDGEFRMVSRTEAGWRYEKYLMIENDGN
jgi:hypothetical protein